MRIAALLLALSFLSGSAWATDRYVDSAGDDSADGSLAHPLRTIAHCASLSVAGDTCVIAPGTYAELVQPPSSGTPTQPITFAAQDPASPPVISGLRALSGFTPYTGAIWQAPSGGSFTSLFVDRQRMILARDPNLASGDPYRPSWYQATADGGAKSIIDTVHLTQPAGFWDGATIHLVAGLGWSGDVGTVTGYDPAAHQITFTPGIFFGAYYSVDQYSVYYLENELALLDAPSEWYLDQTANIAYLWTPDGGDPNQHLVEVDGPNSGFNLIHSSYVRLSNLVIIDGVLFMDSSVGCSVEDVRLLYPREQVTVGGSDNQILRGEIAFANERCVDLWGTRNSIRQSEVHHCDLLGEYRELVRLGGPQNTISDCSLHDTGRDGIGTLASGIDGSIIEHNEVYNTGLIAKDCGAFYSYDANGGGTVLRYNIFHDVWPRPTEQYGGVSLGFGIYFDDGCTNYVAHHNVVYQTGGTGIFLHEPSTYITLVNNTSVTMGNGKGSPIASAAGGGGPDAGGSSVINNLAVEYDDRDACINLQGAVPTYDHNGYFRVTGTAYNSAGVEDAGVIGDPLFVDATGRNFALSSGSPFIDEGMIVPGITDGFIGAAPDIGAYESGASEQPGVRGSVGPAAPDAGVAALDAGATVPDAGSLADAGTSLDAGETLDAGSVGDTPDAGTSRMPVAHGGCESSAGSALLALFATVAVLRRWRGRART